MRVIIFGAKGQLGRDLVRVFSRDYEVVGYDLPELDITNPTHVYHLLSSPTPDLVINSAAYTQVDQAEQDLDACFLVNEIGARLVADLASQWSVPIVYYSTDYVFDGLQRKPYREEDPCNPISVYGRSKLAGEVATRTVNTRYYILRTAWLYGPGGNNFIEKMVQLARKYGKLEVSDDEIGSPTYTWDLACWTKELVQTKQYGLYHATNSGECSRYQWVKESFSLLGLDIPVTPCSRTKFVLPAERPAYSALDNSRLAKVLGHELRTWQEALRDYIQRREGQ